MSNTATKRHKHQQHICEEDESLLPGLPDDVAHLCLSLVHPSLLYSVSKSWRRLVYSPSFPPHLSIYALLLSASDDSINFSCFDPVSSNWLSIPHPQSHRILLRHPSFISRRLPIQSVTVSGNLVLLTATTDQLLPALSRPLLFNPLSLTPKWSHGPPLAAPRRWCAAGASRGVVYVASGIGSHYNSDVAKSIEKWDLIQSSERTRNSGNDWKWEKLEGLRNGKFSRDAIDAVGWRGKLCMVNIKGDAAKEGIIYDVKKDEWEEMPEGMLKGWRGPAAAMDEDIIFMVDESKGVLRKYDPGMDLWLEVVECEELEGAQYAAAAGGRVCVVCSDGVNIAVVDVAAASPRLWVVGTPRGSQALAIHILPRLNSYSSSSSLQDSMIED